MCCLSHELRRAARELVAPDTADETWMLQHFVFTVAEDGYFALLHSDRPDLRQWALLHPDVVEVVA